MTLIEIRPHRWGWKVFEAPGVEPVFPQKRQAINYAENRASFRLQPFARSSLGGAKNRSTMGALFYCQWPAIHTQPPERRTQWPSTQTATGVGRAIHVPGTHTYWAPVQRQ
jgi:hypothetical protein